MRDLVIPSLPRRPSPADPRLPRTKISVRQPSIHRRITTRLLSPVGPGSTEDLLGDYADSGDVVSVYLVRGYADEDEREREVETTSGE